MRRTHRLNKLLNKQPKYDTLQYSNGIQMYCGHTYMTALMAVMNEDQETLDKISNDLEKEHFSDEEKQYQQWIELYPNIHETLWKIDNTYAQEYIYQNVSKKRLCVWNIDSFRIVVESAGDESTEQAYLSFNGDSFDIFVPFNHDDGYTTGILWPQTNIPAELVFDIIKTWQTKIEAGIVLTDNP